jgi:hypothetical protein
VYAACHLYLNKCHVIVLKLRTKNSASPPAKFEKMLSSLRAARSQVRRGYATVINNGPGEYKLAVSDVGQATASLSLVLRGGTRYESRCGVASVLKGFAFKVRHDGQNQVSV